jgi:hypothetical protein
MFNHGPANENPLGNDPELLSDKFVKNICNLRPSTTRNRAIVEEALKGGRPWELTLFVSRGGCHMQLQGAIEVMELKSL